MKKIQLKIKNKKIEAPGVSTIFFSPPKSFQYHSGQFIDVYFPEIAGEQGKSYSLSSSPVENFFSITVKAIGGFSNHLRALKKGGILLSSEPYGFFFSESRDSHLVMLAGGIGVAPFRSIILEELSCNPNRKISLFYSSRTKNDIIFNEELDLWQGKYKNLKVIHFLTREKKVEKGKEKGRITTEKILKEIFDLENLEFLICGSIDFVRDMRKGLRRGGVPEEAIYTEAFFSH